MNFLRTKHSRKYPEKLDLKWSYPFSKTLYISLLDKGCYGYEYYQKGILDYKIIKFIFSRHSKKTG